MIVTEGSLMHHGVLPNDAPIYCPLCGRALFYSYWNTVSGDVRYNSLVCFNGRGAWYRWLREKIKMSEVGGVHYRFDFGPSENTFEPRFDPQTGKRLP